MKTIFKSLISNNSCIDGARKKGNWWVSLLILLFSLIVAVVPTFVQQITSKGSDLFTSSNYGVDFAIQSFLEDANENSITMIVHDADDSHEKKYIESTEFTYSYTYGTNTDVDAIIKFVPEMSSDKFGELIGNRDVTYIVFSSTSIYMDVVNPNTNTYINLNYFICENAYKDFDAGFDIVSLKGDSYISTWNNTLDFIDKAYNYSRVTKSWIQTGFMALIDVVIITLMGLMIFILTRGKNNPFRMYTFFEGQAIAYWASLAPAILTVPLGFLISNFSNIWFPMLIGIRVMWLTMKSLRPDGTGYTGPKEVKTVNTKPVK